MSRARPYESSLAGLITARRSCRAFADTAISYDALSPIIAAAAGQTSNDGGRAAPSAERRYPVRLDVAIRAVVDWSPGVYAYRHRDGTLEPAVDGDIDPNLVGAALDHQPWLGDAVAVLALSADINAENRAFAHQGPRGERYVYIETGAALQNAHLQAVELGLGGVLVAGFDDEAMRCALELPGDYRPTAVLCLGYPGAESAPSS